VCIAATKSFLSICCTNVWHTVTESVGQKLQYRNDVIFTCCCWVTQYHRHGCWYRPTLWNNSISTFSLWFTCNICCYKVIFDFIWFFCNSIPLCLFLHCADHWIWMCFCRLTLYGLHSSLINLGSLNKYNIMGKHEELMAAIRRADVTAVSKQLAKCSGSKSSTFCHTIFTLGHIFNHMEFCIHPWNWMFYIMNTFFVYFLSVNNCVNICSNCKLFYSNFLLLL